LFIALIGKTFGNRQQLRRIEFQRVLGELGRQLIQLGQACLG